MLKFLTQRKNSHIAWLLMWMLHIPMMMLAQTSTPKSVNDLAGSSIESLTIGKWDDTTQKPSSGTGFLLYNPKTQKVINMGGYWGDHVNLDDKIMFFYLASTSTTNEYFIYAPNNIANQGQLLAYTLRGKEKGLYVDGKYETNNKDFFTWIFEPVKTANNDYSYRIKCKGQLDGKSLYITATPDNPNNTCEALTSESLTDDVTEENQEWKLIRKGNYKSLYETELNTMDKNMDITSLLIKDPSFDRANTDFANWKTEGFNNGEIRFGITGCTRTPNGTYTQTCTDDDLCKNSKYMCGEIKGETNGSLYQDITLSAAGWYILKCKGVTNTNYSCLYAIKSNGYIKTISGKNETTHKTTYTHQWHDMPYRTFLQQVKDLPPDNDLTEVSKMINSSTVGDTYTHELLFNVTPKEQDETGKNVKVRIGITTNMETAGDSLHVAKKSKNDYTVFDDFHLEFIGTDGDLETFEKYEDSDQSSNRPATNSFFLRDSAECDMDIMQKTEMRFENKPLYLLHSFKPNQWNTICMPVAIKRKDFYRAFGKGTELAELGEMTENSLRFYSIKDDGSRENMIEAFHAYLIKPTQTYNTVPFYNICMSTFHYNKYGDNIYTQEGWFKGQKATEGVVNNYILLSCTIPHGNIILENQKDVIDANFPHSLFNKYNTFRVARCNETNLVTDGKMKAYGIFASNYKANSKGETISIFDDPLIRMEEAYIFTKDCHFKYVKNGARSYGQRCFFKLLKEDSSSTGNAKNNPDLWIDNIHDEATSINDICDDEEETPHLSGNYANAIYSLSGQLVRQGDTSTNGLPKGIYIVDGKKMLVK